MNEVTIRFVNDKAEFQLVLPGAINRINLTAWRKLLQLMLDSFYREENEEAIQKLTDAVNDLLTDVTKDIDVGVGILTQSTLKSLASKKNKYQKILDFIKEKE